MLTLHFCDFYVVFTQKVTRILTLHDSREFFFHYVSLYVRCKL